MSLLPGRYFIIPEDSYLHGDTLGLPVLPHPLPDLPVGFVKKGYLIDCWLLQSSDNGTYTVFAGKGSNDYKWAVMDDSLFASNHCQPDSFRFESADEDGFYVIRIPDQDLFLTIERGEFPQLNFQPADGSEAQLFQIVPFEKD